MTPCVGMTEMMMIPGQWPGWCRGYSLLYYYWPILIWRILKPSINDVFQLQWLFSVVKVISSIWPWSIDQWPVTFVILLMMAGYWWPFWPVLWPYYYWLLWRIIVIIMMTVFIIYYWKWYSFGWWQYCEILTGLFYYDSLLYSKNIDTAKCIIIYCDGLLCTTMMTEMTGLILLLFGNDVFNVTIRYSVWHIRREAYWQYCYSIIQYW